MRMRRIVYVILVFLALPSLCFGQNAIIQQNLSYQYKSDLPFYSISEINQANLSQGQYNTEGYVIFISSCPPCPKGAVCETCLIDRLFISETDQQSTLTGSKIRKIDLILFADDLKQFKVGEKYKFSIRIPRAYSFDATYMTSYSNRYQIIGHKIARVEVGK